MNDFSPVSYNVTGYRGVSYDRSRRLFTAVVGSRRSGTLKRLGRFQTAIEAAQAYDAAAFDLYGQSAVLNFPLGGEKKALVLRNVSDRFDKDRSGLCANGHDLAEFGKIGVRNNLVCRLCNKHGVLKYQNANGRPPRYTGQ